MICILDPYQDVPRQGFLSMFLSLRLGFKMMAYLLSQVVDAYLA